MARARTQARINAAQAAAEAAAPKEPAGEQVYRNVGPHKLNGVKPGEIVELTEGQARRLIAAGHVEVVAAEDVAPEEVQPGNPPADETAGLSPEVESE